ncbi:hypothetical protein EUTSA_v10002241mg [Eutrema salsugineum]|uniref:Uncharacterized protein n=1 Tax=Eutrema salsugineum TaxID=72664 RepID=V4MCR7_EUTSA|nr:hypothetical protein EUTSA_v10002241mg [Eutrema salsugineum]
MPSKNLSLLVILGESFTQHQNCPITNVVSSAFEGQSPVNRQGMVDKSISEELQNVVHAADQMTKKKAPEEV